VASYEHAYDLVRAHGEVGWTARLVPLTVDGLIYAGSMVMLGSARRKAPVPALARWLLGPGITATLAANMTHQPVHGLVLASCAKYDITRVLNDLRASPSRDVPARSPAVATASPVPAAQHQNH
jgi:uncharacterized protein DUF2637